MLAQCLDGAGHPGKPAPFHTDGFPFIGAGCQLQGNSLGIKVGMMVIDVDKSQIEGLSVTCTPHIGLIGGTAATGEGDGNGEQAGCGPRLTKHGDSFWSGAARDIRSVSIMRNICINCKA